MRRSTLHYDGFFNKWYVGDKYFDTKEQAEEYLNHLYGTVHVQTYVSEDVKFRISEYAERNKMTECAAVRKLLESGLNAEIKED